MRSIISTFLLCFIVFASWGQTKKRDRIKRKYRKSEVVSKELPNVFLRGAVYDEDYNPIAGACVTIIGDIKNVNTNEDGEFLIRGLKTGKTRIQVSFIGYETHTADIDLTPGQNIKNIMLPLNENHVDPLVLTAKKRELQMMDIPTAVSSVNTLSIQKLDITNLKQLSEFVPGAYFYEQGSDKPVFMLRGIRSGDEGVGAQPRVAAYFNNMPVNRAFGASVALFDMDRVEVLRGPQNVLFGKGAEAGAIHYVSKMPDDKLGGYLTARMGNYKQNEFNVAVNIPIVKKKLRVRAAGIYNNCDGYIRNTYGGKLMGKNSGAGRFSISFRHSWNHKFDLVLNYQKDNDPGVAFMSDSIPNAEGNIGAFSGVASLGKGKALKTMRKLFDVALNYRLYMDEHNFWTLIASFRKNNASACWDGDGTALSAMEMDEASVSKQYFCEIRRLFLQGARISGVWGGSFFNEEVTRITNFSTNEAQLEDFVSNSVNGNKEAGAITHNEEKNSKYKNTTYAGFLDLTCQFNPRIFFSGGVRVIFDCGGLSYESIFIDSSRTSLGTLYGAIPNILYKPVELQNNSKNTLLFASHLGVKYRYSESLNFFVNYSRGIRPAVLQYNSAGEYEEQNTEKLNSFEVGLKSALADRVSFDLSGFFQFYKDFQTPVVKNNGAGNPIDVLCDAGKADIYGLEANLEVALIKQLHLFVRYAWLKTKFASENIDGEEQKYAGNVFTFSPEHSVVTGFYAKVKLMQGIQLFLTPSYTYKSVFFFNAINTQKQKAYGLFNVDCGIRTKNPDMTFSFWAKNITGEQYIVGVGISGENFRIKTSLPSPPRMLGGKLIWNFRFNERPYYKRH